MKEKFIDKLYKNLNFLTTIEIKKQLDKYSNLIDELVSTGLSEKKAISSLGSFRDIINDIKEEYGINKDTNIKEERVTKDSLNSSLNDEEKGSSKQLFKIIAIVLITLASLLFGGMFIYCFGFLTLTYTFIDLATIILLFGLIILFLGLLLTSVFGTYYLFSYFYKSRKNAIKGILIVSSCILSLGLMVIFISFSSVDFDVNNLFNYGKYTKEVKHFSLDDDLYFVDCTDIEFNVVLGDYQDPYIVVYSNDKVSFDISVDDNVEIKQNGVIPQYLNFPKMKIEVYYHEGYTNFSTFNFNSEEVNVVIENYIDIKTVNVEAYKSNIVMMSTILTGDVDIKANNSEISFYESIIESVNIYSAYSGLYLNSTLPESINVDSFESFYSFKYVNLGDDFILNSTKATILLEGVSSNSKVIFDVDVLSATFDKTAIDDVLINSNDAHINISGASSNGLFEFNCLKLNLFVEGSILNNINSESQNATIQMDELMSINDDSVINIESTYLEYRLLKSQTNDLIIKSTQCDIYFKESQMKNTLLDVNTGTILGELTFGFDSYKFIINTTGISNVVTGGSGENIFTVNSVDVDIYLTA